MSIPIKVVHEFEDGGFGFTETHYMNSADDNPDLPVILTQYAQRVAVPRGELLAGRAKSKSIRVSFPTPLDVTSLIAPAAFGPGYPTNGQTGVDVTLVARFHDARGLHRKITHLRGIPDIIVDGQYYVPGKLNDFATRVKTWTDACVANLGWMKKDPTNSNVNNNTTYTNLVDDRVSFTAGAPFFNLIRTPVGSLVTITVSKFDKGRNSLNTSHVVRVLSTTNCVTNYPVASMTGVGQVGTMRYRAVAFSPYVSGDILGVGTRKAGRSFFASRGRARATGRS